jgi:hypothetical protein
MMVCRDVRDVANAARIIDFMCVPNVYRVHPTTMGGGMIVIPCVGRKVMGIEMILSDIVPLIVGFAAIWIVWKIISGMLRVVISLVIVAAIAYLFMGNM